MPFVERLLDSVVARQGARHPGLDRIAELFRGVAEDLIEHMDREERVLFPYLRTLAHGRPAGRPMFGPVASPIGKLEEEHRSAEAEFLMIRTLTDDYQAPPGSPELQASYDAIEALERDLQEHVAFEHDVLFPSAIRIERGQADRAK